MKKKEKCLGINIAKAVQDWNTKNYKALFLKQLTLKRKDIPCS